MVPTVKICGLATAATLEAALDAGADMVGLVFFAKSPRFVGLDHARELAAQARDRARIVALTVDAEDDLLGGDRRIVGPDMLQLHGRETPQRVAAIKQAFGLPAIKAIGVSEAADFARAPRIRERRRLAADRRQAAEGRRSARRQRRGRSTGASRAVSRPQSRGCCRAGSTPATSARRSRFRRARGVDVSSGVESAPGVKDVKKIAAFVAAARAAFAREHEAGSPA